MDREQALETLRRCHAQLPEGRRLVVSNRDTGIDPVEQVYEEERRYELFEGDTLVRTEIRAGQGRWYFRNELLLMLRMAGFEQVEVTGDFTDEEYDSSHSKAMVFVATRQ